MREIDVDKQLRKMYGAQARFLTTISESSEP
jgi:hypothetical protein